MKQEIIDYMSARGWYRTKFTILKDYTVDSNNEFDKTAFEVPLDTFIKENLEEKELWTTEDREEFPLDEEELEEEYELYKDGED
jgi:hypothetical protein